MEKLISCIITTHKRQPEILRRAIDSVLNQTYQNFELIVVNDYPEDKELEKHIQQLINSYDGSKVKYISHDKNRGACQARNTGINASNGEYIALLDDDDEWMSQKLEEQIILFTDRTIGLVYCDSIIKSDGKESIHHCVPKAYKDNIIKALLYTNFIGGNSFPLIRRSVFVECGMYDTKMKALQDLDMWVRIAQKYCFAYCQQPLVINHISDVSITTISDNRISGFRRIIKKYEQLYLQYPDVYHEKMLAISGELIVIGRLHEAVDFYRQGIRVNPLSVKNFTVPCKSILLKLRRVVLKY